MWQNQFLFGLQTVSSLSKRIAVFCSALTANVIFNLNDQGVSMGWQNGYHLFFFAGTGFFATVSRSNGNQMLFPHSRFMAFFCSTV